MVTEDLHVHTCFSTDSEADMRESVCVAIKKGLKRMAFTDHMDLDYPERYRDEIRESMGEKGIKLHPDFERRPVFTFDTDAYFEKLSVVRKEFADKIEILSGIEMGMRPNRPDILNEYKCLLSKNRFDVVLGSLHLVTDEDPFYKEVWEGRSVDETISVYFKELAECVRDYDMFTSLAHIDYIARYIPKDMTELSRAEHFNAAYEKNKETIDYILKTIIERKQALEINTNGIFNGLGHFHPSEPILEAYKRFGGALFTYGTDSHNSQNVGGGLNGI